MRSLAFDSVEGIGHPEVRATHRTTFEITREAKLTKRGTCILAVSANKAASDLDEKLKESLKAGARLKITIRTGGLSDVIWGLGSADLKFGDLTSMVFRKSNFVDDRTVCIECNKSASEIDRRIISMLALPTTRMLMELEGFA